MTYPITINKVPFAIKALVEEIRKRWPDVRVNAIYVEALTKGLQMILACDELNEWYNK